MRTLGPGDSRQGWPNRSSNSILRSPLHDAVDCLGQGGDSKPEDRLRAVRGLDLQRDVRTVFPTLELDASRGVNRVADVLGPRSAGGNRDGRIISTAPGHAKQRQIVDFRLRACRRVQHVERDEPAFVDCRESVQGLRPGLARDIYGLQDSSL
jgi:hypothetical protein